MLEGLDFHPLPDRDDVYVLTNQHHNADAHATRVVDLLRRAGYQIQTDLALDPDLSSTAQRRSAPTGSTARPDPTPRPENRTWRSPSTHDSASSPQPPTTPRRPSAPRRSSASTASITPALGIYAMPASVGRSEAVRAAADTAFAMHAQNLNVAAHPDLAAAVTSFTNTSTKVFCSAPACVGEGIANIVIQ